MSEMNGMIRLYNIGVKKKGDKVLDTNWLGWELMAIMVCCQVGEFQH